MYQYRCGKPWLMLVITLPVVSDGEVLRHAVVQDPQSILCIAVQHCDKRSTTRGNSILAGKGFPGRPGSTW